MATISAGHAVRESLFEPRHAYRFKTTKNLGEGLQDAHGTERSGAADLEIGRRQLSFERVWSTRHEPLSDLTCHPLCEVRVCVSWRCSIPKQSLFAVQKRTYSSLGRHMIKCGQNTLVPNIDTNTFAWHLFERDVFARHVH